MQPNHLSSLVNIQFIKKRTEAKTKNLNRFRAARSN